MSIHKRYAAFTSIAPADKAELIAHHSLPEKIREVDDGSRFLIVLCSPAAKASHWVKASRRFRASVSESVFRDARMTVLGSIEECWRGTRR